MAWDKGLNFRATSGYVSDGADETYVLHSDAYPTTRNGVTFGWEVPGIESRDRNAGLDRRLAGINFDRAEANKGFRVDLPATGTYALRAAFGDAGGNNYYDFALQDDATVFKTFAATLLTAAAFSDATGAILTSTDWPGSNQAIDRTFASQVFRVTEVADHVSNVIAHLFLSQVSSATPSPAAGAAEAAACATGSAAQAVWPTPTSRPIRGLGRQSSGATIVARITSLDGAAVTPESIAGVTRIVSDQTLGLDVSTVQLAPADVLLGSLQAGGCWDLDEAGYCFRDDLPASLFAAGDHVYRAQYRLVPASHGGDPWTFAAEFPAEEVLSG